jgi:hypothetical protein
MSMTASFLTSLVLAVMMTDLGYCGQDFGAYLTEKDGRKALKEPLTLREEQEGIAGTTGTVWTIEPSGQWRVARMRHDRDGTERLTPLRSGKLPPDRMEALAKVLAERNLTGMPEKIGREAKVNPHRVTLKFGQKTATIEGLPARRNLTVAELIRKSTPANEQAAADVWDRFAHMAQAVESHCQEAEKP